MKIKCYEELKTECLYYTITDSSCYIQWFTTPTMRQGLNYTATTATNRSKFYVCEHKFSWIQTTSR